MLRMTRKLILFTRFAVAGMVAAAGLLTSVEAQAGKFQISSEADSNFKAYLRDITSTNNGAFAVTRDGMSSYYIYCEEASFCQPVSEALKKCRQNYRQECKILAKGKDPEMEFEVVEPLRSLGDSDPIKTRVLGQNDLKQAIVGNTLSGYYLNQVKWSEYYSADGKLYGKDDVKGTYEAKYEIKGGKLCFIYPEASRNWCSMVSRDGDRVDIMNESGDLVNILIDTRLLAGRH